MFWADKVANEIISSGRYKPYWVDDMKTPSGRIHVGGLRAVTTHDIVYKALLSAGVKAKFTYVFDNHDPMDSFPEYLPKEYKQYLGVPLFMIPSPQKGFANFAEFYAKEFQDGFRRINCNPQIIWTTDLYFSGKMNDGIKKCLDNVQKIRKIYEDLYKKQMPENWYPFNVYCPKCNKVSTTKTIGWDGKEVDFECRVDAVLWTKGCGYKGKISPFATKDKINGKLPWKVEWAVKWQAIGVTIEGAGKDHMTAGGSHDLAKRVSEEILGYETPYAFAHEFFLIGGRKMSTSKGAGISVSDLLEILPPYMIRFLIVKTKLNQAINFDPAEKDTIPNLFDDYQKASDAYFKKIDKDLARVFELSQISKPKKPPSVRFTVLTQWVQMPNMEDEIEKQGLTEWAKYARVWIDRFAPEDQKFTVQKKMPLEVHAGEKIKVSEALSVKQKTVLSKISDELDKEWSGDDFQIRIYEIGKDLGLSGKETFQAIYLALLGKDHGPKAGWLILSLDKEFVRQRFNDASK